MFKIAPSRGSEVLIEVLGREFDGVLGCDYFIAYRKYMGDCGVLVQFCLAHLIRDLQFLAEHPNPENQSYGRRVLEATRRLFDLIHRRDLMKPQTFTSTLELLGKALCRTAVKDVPSTSEAANLALASRNTAELHQVHHDARHRADQQFGRASDSLRGHRPTHNPRLAKRNRTVPARAGLDDHRHLHPARSFSFDFLLEAVRASFQANPLPHWSPTPADRREAARAK